MGKNISPFLENKGNHNALSELSFEKIWTKSPLFVKASHDHCFLQWVTQHLLFMFQFTLPWGSAATSTQMPSLPLGDSFPNWRHQGECESSKQKSLCCSCHPLAGSTQWGMGYCPFWRKERKKKAENSLFQHLKWGYVPHLSQESHLEIFCYCLTCLVGNNYWSLLLKSHSG